MSEGARPGRAASWRRRRGLTLVEMIATITILAIVGASVLPVIEAAGSHYAESATLRRSSDRVAFAMDRICRVLREIPAADDGDGLAIAAIEPDAITLTDGREIRLESNRIIIEIDGQAGMVCDDVAEFVIVATGADGLTPTDGSPRDTRRLGIGIVAGGVDVRSAVFPRACMGGG